MSNHRWTVIAVGIAGIAFIAIAIVYFAEPAKSRARLCRRTIRCLRTSFRSGAAT